MSLSSKWGENVMEKTDSANRMRTIGLEEHYASPSFWDGPGNLIRAQYTKMGSMLRRTIIDDLTDLSEKRISAMDSAGLDMAVLSLLSPGVQQLDPSHAVALANNANDYVAEAVKKFPNRFAAFATLPTVLPESAAEELEFRVKRDGFKGGVINGRTGDRYMDDKIFWPIFEKAESLNVPIYLHPVRPPQKVIDAYYSGFSNEVTNLLSDFAIGWHLETLIHIVRLILGGVFDRFPKLQIITGHLGEGLPFFLSRLDEALPVRVSKIERPIGSYLRENIYYTFSGYTYLPNFLDLYLQVGASRILFSTDYPLLPMERSIAFLNSLPISPAEKQLIAHENAERLLKIN